MVMFLLYLMANMTRQIRSIIIYVRSIPCEPISSYASTEAFLESCIALNPVILFSCLNYVVLKSDL